MGSRGNRARSRMSSAERALSSAVWDIAQRKTARAFDPSTRTDASIRLSREFSDAFVDPTQEKSFAAMTLAWSPARENTETPIRSYSIRALVLVRRRLIAAGEASQTNMSPLRSGMTSGAPAPTYPTTATSGGRPLLTRSRRMCVHGPGFGCPFMALTIVRIKGKMSRSHMMTL